MPPPLICHSPVPLPRHDEGEQKTRRVLVLTLVTMVLEIVVGWLTGSMALLADGWHMGSHGLALGLAWGAYVLSRRYAKDGRFSFGTWKIEVLAGYTSALLLLGIAFAMVWESLARLLNPVSVLYAEALPVALLGLGVNLLSAYWLHGEEGHPQGHHDHDHAHHRHHDHHHDLNLKAAYLHVLADAATSVFAILALVAGYYWQIGWMDPAMGLLGAALVASWSWGLLRETGRALLDAGQPEELIAEVRQILLEIAPAYRLADLHLWQVGPGHFSCIVGLHGASPEELAVVRSRLAEVHEIVHLSLTSH